MKMKGVVKFGIFIEVNDGFVDIDIRFWNCIVFFCFSFFVCVCCFVEGGILI